MTRSGFWTPDQTRQVLGHGTAQLDHESGRTWRLLQDTADAVPDSMVSRIQWRMAFLLARRGITTSKGVLIWLEANEIIREKTAGKKSMDDFSKIFFKGEDGVPMVKTYDEAEVFNTLNAVAPYDWAKFFHDRLRKPGSARRWVGWNAGWRLTYSSQPNIYMDTGKPHSIDALYSIGIAATAGGNITDSLRDGPAFTAGLTPGMIITQVNGAKKWSPAALQAAVAAASAGTPVVTATMAA